MAYLVTAKRGGLELRDGSLATDTMHKLVMGVSVLFRNMPNGYRVPGDAQVSVVIAPERCEDIPAPERCEDIPDMAPVPMPMEITPEPSPDVAPTKRHKKHKG